MQKLPLIEVSLYWNASDKGGICMDPKISIIVPIYKAEQYVQHCVDSLLEQTYPNFELILVNDGSPDRSGFLCDEYAVKDKRIIVKHQSNQGVSSARNTGLLLATGDYILFVDSDDYLAKNALQILVNHMHDVDALVFGSVKKLLSNQMVLKSERNGFYKKQQVGIEELANDFIYYLHSAGMQPSWSYLFKRELIEQHDLSFNEQMVLYEDFDFNLRYLKQCTNMCFIPDVLYHYQIPVHVNQLAKRNKINIAPDVGAVCQSLMDFLMSQQASEQVMQQAYTYMLPMYTLCLTNLLLHRKESTMKEKYDVFRCLNQDPIFKQVIAEKGKELAFYRILHTLISKRRYLLSYFLLYFRLSS